MNTITVNQFTPDYAVHPGAILEEILEAKNISKSEFAERVGVTPKTVSQIVSGAAPVRPENAIAFERVLGVVAEVWNNLEAEFRLFQARKKSEQCLEDAIDWSKRFPIAALIKRGIIPNTRDPKQIVSALLNLFRVKDPDAWTATYGNLTVAFRKSAAFKSNYEAVVTWLRIAEIKAEGIQTDKYDSVRFRESLSAIRKMTAERPATFEPNMKSLCRDSGVALVFVSELPKTRLSGATRWLSSDKAMIAMSLRHKSNDHFWFTFFHEAGHILKHSRKDIYIDEPEARQTNEENEANEFASTFLLKRDLYDSFVTGKTHFSKQAVEQFATQAGIAPGVVVGRLQHDKKIDFSWLNELKVRFSLVENQS